jgi:hypothetical protein
LPLEVRLAKSGGRQPQLAPVMLSIDQDAY